MKQSTGFCLTILAAGLLCLTFAVGTQAFAATENACSKDIEKFCKNIKPGRMALLACLEAHESELSAECKAYEQKMEGRREEAMEQARIVKKFRQDCKADMVKFCSGSESAKGGTLKCMNEHKGELSPTCSQWLKALNQE
jgi:hypothetical protein